jgi:hypothetical protein
MELSKKIQKKISPIVSLKLSRHPYSRPQLQIKFLKISN